MGHRTFWMRFGSQNSNYLAFLDWATAGHEALLQVGLEEQVSLQQLKLLFLSAFLTSEQDEYCSICFILVCVCVCVCVWVREKQLGLCLTFWGAAKLFQSAYFELLHILTNTHLSNWLLPFQCIWIGISLLFAFPYSWWLMMLSIFSSAYWLYIFFGGLSIQTLGHFLVFIFEL